MTSEGTRDHQSGRVLSCPHCGGDADLCTASDHGSVNGPAIHCRDCPRHNEFDQAEFSRWEASHV